MKQQKGFTIVELMIATTVFSVILLIISYGLIYASKTYSSSVTKSRTQEATRSIIDNIAQAVQFGGGSSVVHNANADHGAICIGGRRYVYQKNVQVNPDGTQRALYEDSSKDCGAAGVPPNITALGSGQELLSEGMFVRDLSVSQVNTSLYRIVVHVIYIPVGEDPATTSLLNGDNCSGGPGSEFCASSRLETVVEKRI